MNTLKMMFSGGGDIAELAEMIRRFGRGEDKILAHITPEEAAKLKEMGGSGTINPMTGLPEFQEEDEYGRLLASESDGSQLANYEGVDAPFQNFNQPQYDGVDAQFQGFDTQYGDMNQDRSFLPPDAIREMEIADAQRAAAPAVGGRQVTPEEESIFGRAERNLQELRGTLDRYPTLTRLGGAGANIIAQGLLAQRAARGREAEAARLRERAAPFRAAETEAMARAQGGGLTPQQAREAEIAQQRARQGLGAQNLTTGSAASGILAGQMQRARSAARQESLQSALDLAQIADRYERAAIQEELAKDADLSRLFAEVIGKEIQAASRTQAPQRRA
jgi:hypothetical protein